jgi:putative transposase
MSNDVIAIEDLHIANMVKNRHLSKSISDAGWHTFRMWLEHLARVYGKEVVAVPPLYTIQECSRCGTLVKNTLSERTHVCPKCGLVLGHDHTSGRVIVSRGLALLGDKLPQGIAESHAWGEMPRYAGRETALRKAARRTRNPIAL